MSKVATLTMNPCVDVFTAVDRISSTHKLRCRPPRRDPGGGGINVARVIHTLGGDALALFAAGGPTGDFLQQLLRDAGVRFQSIAVEALSRESFTMLEEATGGEYRFVMPGPELRSEEWQACLEALTRLTPPPEYLVASGSLPPGVPEDFYARVARWARQNRVRMVLDTSGEALRVALAEGVYLVKPNRRELEEMTGRSLEEQSAQEAACRQLLEEGGSEIVALTLGRDGALLTWSTGSYRIAVPEVEVNSAVGAGDSFLAGVIQGLVAGKSLQQAFCLGSAAGTAALLTPGTELCRREDVERLYRQICTAREGIEDPHLDT